MPCFTPKDKENYNSAVGDKAGRKRGTLVRNRPKMRLKLNRSSS